jgi:hypothetical protein
MLREKFPKMELSVAISVNEGGAKTIDFFNIMTSVMTWT